MNEINCLVDHGNSACNCFRNRGLAVVLAQERIEQLESQLSDLKKEHEEQARLLGMSGSREAALLAKVDELTKLAERIADGYERGYRNAREDAAKLFDDCQCDHDKIPEGGLCYVCAKAKEIRSLANPEVK